MPTLLPHEQAMVHAKVAFMKDEKAMFLYTVCFHLKFKWDDTLQPPTAKVDGYKMTFHPEFFMLISHEMRVTLLAHETGHVVREHMGRRGDRDPKIWNFAGDYVINQELKESGYTPIAWTDPIDGSKYRWLQDDRFAGMSTERVYDILFAENPPPPPDQGGGSSAPGGSGDPDDVWQDLEEPGTDAEGEPVTQAQVREHLDSVIISAAMACKINGQPGSVPGDVQLYLDSLLKPKLPMASHLRQFFQALQKNDYTWARPSRRSSTFYLPSMRSEALIHLAFAFDMSCSVRDEDIKRYVSELVGVMRNLKPDKITLVQFDTRIISVDVIKSVQDIMRLKLCGRGGTYIGPLMEWAKKTKPNALIVFTDGEFSVVEERPTCPILWMIHNKRRTFTYPIGTVIPFEV